MIICGGIVVGVLDVIRGKEYCVSFSVGLCDVFVSGSGTLVAQKLPLAPAFSTAVAVVVLKLLVLTIPS